MRLTNNPTVRSGSLDEVALDLEALGRLVRQRALEAVAMHFDVLARMPRADSTAGDTDHESGWE